MRVINAIISRHLSHTNIILFTLAGHNQEKVGRPEVSVHLGRSAARVEGISGIIRVTFRQGRESAVVWKR